MYDSLIPLIQQQVDSAQIVRDIAQIHARDRWFTYPKFNETADYAARRLQKIGAKNVEIIRFPADGKTLFGTWRGGFAWDAKSATLTLLTPRPLAGKVLADYRQIPCSLAMWSAPTPKAGIEADIIDVGTGAAQSDYDHKPVRGNIIFANARAGAIKGLAAANGAIGILTDWNPQQDKNLDAVFWNNSFNDAPGGWPLTADCSRMFCFGITRRQGIELRQQFAAGQKFRALAKVNTRLYEGTFPVVTARIPGRSSDEILALAHAFEQGAKDNASGVACILEACRILAALIQQKKLPAPKRSIRTLVTNECFGTIGYVDRFPARTKNTAAAICLDETGIDQKSTAEIQSLIANPQSNASYLDAFIPHLADAVWKKPHFNPHILKPYASSDNMIAHPSIGIPAVWIGCHGSRITWHTTLDTPDRMDPRQLAAAAVYTAVYLYFLANAGPAEALWLANLAAAAAEQNLQQELSAALAQSLALSPARRRPAAEKLAARFAYLLLVHDQSIAGVLRLSAAAPVKAAVLSHQKNLRRRAGQLLASLCKSPPKIPVKITSPYNTPTPKNAAKIRPAPLFSGPITYDTIPLKDRQNHPDPRWGTPVNIALGWANGKRTLPEIIALTEHESQHPHPTLAQELLWLIPKGLLKPTP